MQIPIDQTTVSLEYIGKYEQGILAYARGMGYPVFPAQVDGWYWIDVPVPDLPPFKQVREELRRA